MRKSLKIATVAAVAMLALGAVALVYAYQQNLASANVREQQMETWSPSTFFWPHNATLSNNVTIPCPIGRMPRMGRYGFGWNVRMLQNATNSTVTGTVVTEVSGMLVLNTASGQIRVSLPQEWTVGDEVINRTSLFNGAFASTGQTVTVYVLESILVSNTSFNINTMLGYKATNATGTDAYAVLPFNIQPAS
jgi:hypothetical protein